MTDLYKFLLIGGKVVFIGSKGQVRCRDIQCSDCPVYNTYGTFRCTKMLEHDLWDMSIRTAEDLADTWPELSL